MVPLNVVLSHALLDLTRASERGGAHEVVLWSNLLRVVGDEGVARTALPSFVRLSKRAVRTTVDGLVRHDWASIDDGVLRLTDVGRRAREEWGAAILRAEASWPAASPLRAPLEEFVSRLPLEHSHFPCGYGPADWRVTGGQGVDWVPVQREPGSASTLALPMLALLSQALVGFAAEYESRHPFALLVGVHLDAAFADGPVPLAEVPPVLMVAGNGRSSLERHGAVIVDSSKQARLTPLGHIVRVGYRPTVEAVESSLDPTGALRAALESAEPGGWTGHADHPDVRHVRGHVGFAEVSGRSRQKSRRASSSPSSVAPVTTKPARS